MKRVVRVFNRHAVAPWGASDGFNIGEQTVQGVAEFVGVVGHRRFSQAGKW